MIIFSRTPYRVSLFGGGSDYNQWLDTNAGATINFSIKLYSNLIIRDLSPVFGSKYRIRYFEREEVSCVEHIKHPIVRHALSRWMNRHPDAEDAMLDIIHSGDIPAMTGMGTSSCFTVGLVKALESFIGSSIPKYELAKEAIYIEQILNKEPVGYQDQIAAAFGGINLINYDAPGKFRVIPVNAAADWLNDFIGSLRLVYTGLTRYSGAVAEDMLKHMAENQQSISLMVKDAIDCYKLMVESGSQDDIGLMLADAWKRKKQTSTLISSVEVDNLYQRLQKAGMSGGKLLGAGGGGFILAYIPKTDLQKFAESTRDLTVLPVEVDWLGSTASVVHNTI